MAKQLWANNAKSTLSVAIDDTDTTISLQTGDGALFPTITGSDYFKATIYQVSAGQEINHEIVKVTANASDDFTVVRAQEGTVALSFDVDDPIALRLTAGDVSEHSIGNIPIGGYVFVQTNLTGAEEPDATNYIKLTAGLTGSGQYNEGKLTSESVTGSAPLVVATAVINDAGSPMNGQTVNLINTENRYIMPGTSAGTVANDQMQLITGELIGGQENLTGNGAFSAGNALASNRPGNGTASARSALFSSANSSGARTGTSTNVKHIQVTAYMRIK